PDACARGVAKRSLGPRRPSSRSTSLGASMAEAKGATTTKVTLEEIVALCKRRGFIFPSSEIYGGLGSTYDYGHYGVLLRNNVKDEWWRPMLRERDDAVALDAT